MNMLRNFTIRFVMLTIRDLLFNVGRRWTLQHGPSRVSDGNEVDRQLVKQMTILSGQRSVFPLRYPTEPRDGSQSRRRYTGSGLRPAGAG